MSVTLFARRAGQGPAVMLLHGLFGSGANLGALARSLREHYTVISLDLPNHGRSGALATPDLPGMAAAVRAWMDSEGVPVAHLVGHSLGGKVAMQLGLDNAARVASLVVADIAPVSYTAHHDAVFAALAAVQAGSCHSRQDAAALMASHVQDEALIQFLLSSFVPDAQGKSTWRFDLAGIRASYPALLAAPRSDQAYPGPVLFIRGGDSDYLQQRHLPAITSLFPAATLAEMPGCGHWLHVQDPAGFNRLVSDFLAATARQDGGGQAR